MRNQFVATRSSRTVPELVPADSSSSPPTPAPSPTPSIFTGRYRSRTPMGSLSPPHIGGGFPVGDHQISELSLSPPSTGQSKRSGSGSPSRQNAQRVLFSDLDFSGNHPASSRQASAKLVPLSDHIFTNIKEYFFQLDETSKKLFLQGLLEPCERDVLASTQEFIAPLLKKDPFEVLPREISFKILSYIDDPKTLARASQVSRLWYLILSDDLTWKELCKSHHFRRLSAAVNISHLQHRPSTRMPSIVADRAALDELAEAQYDPEATKKPIATSYRSHFKHQYMLNAAWNSGGRLAARYVISNPGVVTSLIMSNRYIVIALDNSKIFVFREDGKMLRSLFGHVMGVWALTLLENTLVSGGCDRDVRVWDLKSGNCLQILRGHSSTVRCLEMVDATTAVSGSRDTTIRVWDLQRGSCRRVLQGHSSSVRCLEVHGDICVSGSYDFTAKVWRISDGTLLHTLAGHFSQIYCLAFDGVKIATGSLDASVRVWSAETGECLGVLQGHTSLVGQVQMKDKVLVSGGSDGAVRVWDLNTYTCVHRFAAHDNSVTSLQFDENRIVSGGSDGRVRVWDMTTGRAIRDLSSQFDSVWRVAFKDEKVAILASKNNKIYMELISFTPPKDMVEQDVPPGPMMEFRTKFHDSSANATPPPREDRPIAPTEGTPDDTEMMDIE
ncbi:hypothetical protein TRVA0_024S00320 [Trichomonascus vanleenenianus]|uniref:F-box/WD repeat-containing protein n=1 Tax=Trichomonascus vanleenenianus TaxID=2268995 RepID=UPI003ECB0EDD